MSIAIVTGASSGIGMEFVMQIAEKEGFGEIWVLARRMDRLEELKSKVQVPILTIGADLSKSEGSKKLAEILEEREPEVGLLINAAGFGKLGNYEEVNAEISGNMIDLNCRGLVEVTLNVLPYMKKGSRVLQICSTSSFQPLPGLNVYAATKAFVQSYSRALRWELMPRGIKVTAVCPYWVKDTEFISLAESTDKDEIRHYPFSSRAESVVRVSLWASRFNLPVVTPGIASTIQWIAAKFIPREIIIGLWQIFRKV